MDALKNNDFHILRIDRGEKIVQSILEYAEREGIRAGFLWGIGATSSAEIGWFDPQAEVYRTRVIEQPCEITTLLGNIGRFEGKPIAHIHITLGLPDYSIVGGHLMEGTVGVTCEIWIQERELEIRRSVSNIGNLKLLDFS